MNFDSSNSLHIKPAIKGENSSTIDSQTLLQLKDELGKYDSSIKMIIPRANFYGIVKSRTSDSMFLAKAIDPTKDRGFITSSLQIVSGGFLDTKKRSSILLSHQLSEKLGVVAGDKVELYTLNRDNFKEESREEVNRISVFVDGTFQSGIGSRETIIIPLYLSDQLLKNADIDEVIVDLYSEGELQRVKRELEPFLQKLSLKISDREVFPYSSQLGTILYILSIVFGLVLLFMAGRTVSLLIDRRRFDIETLIHYGWSESRIKRQFTKEMVLFTVFSTALNIILVTVFTGAISELPALFTNYPLSVGIDVNYFQLLSITAGVSLGSGLLSIISIRSRKIELRRE
jgi:ABC-type lipoprotein release transport system permease subunit